MMLAVVAVLYAAFWFVPLLGDKAEALFETHPPSDQRVIGGAFAIGTMVVLLVAPMFMGTYISNVFNLVALYAIMGIGLNVMIGYTGLLDLGYVASYAIGAYTLGILTSPSLLTCGGADPSNIFNPAELAELCTNTLTFWQALPFCVLVSATTGMLLGVPVLRLRGDYLAIVTLGFGEITNRIILSNDFKPLLGGAQGVAPIPSPVINLSAINSNWLISFNDSSSIYYLFLASVALTALIVGRLVFMRTGRAWRAIRADEDVAQAMGINLMNYKLLAFGISSAFAGLGGAVFGASLQGIFPNSFTIFVSINVLSLIIIGGMGSIPGVIVGALILVGLPELLRELDAYRLLTFGTLLVAVMVLKPDGLIPPQPPELSERAEQSRRGKEPSHA
jgi:branched-chain amino acid transport system permease protein